MFMYAFVPKPSNSETQPSLGGSPFTSTCRLSAARDAFLTEKEKLQLPGTVRLSPDAFFETPRIRVEFEVSSPQAFRDAVAALSRSSRESALDRLFLAS